MFRIGEFSKLTHVSIRMLRYYDENQLLLPEYVDEMTGYRMYTTKQIEQLKRILFLRELGFGIAQMKEMMKSWDNDGYLKQCLIDQQLTIQNNIEREKEMLARLQSAIVDMDHQTLESNLQVTMKHLPSLHVLSLRRVVENYYQEGLLWKEFMEELVRQQRIDFCSNASFSIYHEQELEQGVDMELCILLPELPSNVNWLHSDCILQYKTTKEITNAACFFVYGPFEKIDGAYQAFALWLEQHPQYRIKGECRQIVHKGPQECEDPNDYVIELQVEVTIQT